MIDQPNEPPLKPVFSDMISRQQRIEEAINNVLAELKSAGNFAALSMTTTSLVMFAVMELLIHKGLITSGEAIASIDGLMAERFGEIRGRVEQNTADILLQLLQGLKSEGK